MDERDFFDERPTVRTHSLVCPHCKQARDYEIGWVIRKKKARLGRNAGVQDLLYFDKALSYMVRRDDEVDCRNTDCRKHFEIEGVQSVAFI